MVKQHSFRFDGRKTSEVHTNPPKASHMPGAVNETPHATMIWNGTERNHEPRLRVTLSLDVLDMLIWK